MRINWIVTGFIVLAAGLSVAFYRHRGRQYAEGKSEAIASAADFRWMYRYLQLSTILVAVASQWSNHAAWLVVFRSTWLAVVGLVLSTIGLALFIWAKVALGRAYSPCFDSLLPQEVVSTGPYRWVRHPIYTGNVLLLLGMFVVSGSLWLVLNTSILALYYYRAALVEERALAKRFPDYAALVSRTGRFLPRIPSDPVDTAAT